MEGDRSEVACDGREGTTIRMCHVEGGSEVGKWKGVKGSVNVLASEAVVSSIRRLLELRDSLVCLIRL